MCSRPPYRSACYSTVQFTLQNFLDLSFKNYILCTEKSLYHFLMMNFFLFLFFVIDGTIFHRISIDGIVIYRTVIGSTVLISVFYILLCTFPNRKLWAAQSTPVRFIRSGCGMFDDCFFLKRVIFPNTFFIWKFSPDIFTLEQATGPQKNCLVFPNYV